LGHKQLEENPWDTFETLFSIGSVHKGTVIQKVEKGAIIELPYGIEGFCLSKNLAKETGGSAEQGESLDFKVMEFNKEDKRIVVSHTHSKLETEVEEKKAEKKEGGKKASSKNAAKPKEAEKETLGDFEALSNLKDSYEVSEKKSKK